MSSHTHPKEYPKSTQSSGEEGGGRRSAGEKGSEEAGERERGKGGVGDEEAEGGERGGGEGGGERERDSSLTHDTHQDDQPRGPDKLGGPPSSMRAISTRPSPLFLPVLVYRFFSLPTTAPSRTSSTCRARGYLGRSPYL
jgi:hypothetical protein